MVVEGGRHRDRPGYLLLQVDGTKCIRAIRASGFRRSRRERCASRRVFTALRILRAKADRARDLPWPRKLTQSCYWCDSTNRSPPLPVTRIIESLTNV